MGTIMIGVPTYCGDVAAETMMGLFQCTKDHKYNVTAIGMSLLTRVFNTLFCAALNARKHGVTHFLLHHADIGPDGNWWLDRMMAIMEEKGADVLSAVVPIKSPLGLTSTALDEGIEGRDLKYSPRRLTLKEVHALDPTFTHPRLLVNTGLMLVDIRKPWVEKIHFRFEDEILWEDGVAKVRNWPEDWLFSRDAKALGANLWATREIKVLHAGRANYSNGEVWGQMDTDRAIP